jgi:hypothetical protein
LLILLLALGFAEFGLHTDRNLRRSERHCRLRLELINIRVGLCLINIRVGFCLIDIGLRLRLVDIGLINIGVLVLDRVPT